jgi:hypothetical protein
MGLPQRPLAFIARHRLLLAFGAALLAVALAAVAVTGNGLTGKDEEAGPADERESDLSYDGRRFEDMGFRTDLSRRSIDLELLLSGGPGKDGIPALTKLRFVAASEADLRNEVRGIMVEFDGERRFYPFSILVWHEVANDSIGDTHFAVTFCPLCGSGVVFDRRVDGEVLEFGVSGLLYESNLVMYDQVTHSLWSQSLGESIVGRHMGTRLEILPMQLLTFEEARRTYPDILVLSDDTGFSRDYERNPYAGYEETETLVFPVTVQDKRFFAKELMYVFRLGGKSVAFPLERLGEEPAKRRIAAQSVVASRDGGEISVTVDDLQVPGYVEMWFSWATQHQSDGLVWDLE